MTHKQLFKTGRVSIRFLRSQTPKFQALFKKWKLNYSLGSSGPFVHWSRYCQLAEPDARYQRDFHFNSLEEFLATNPNSIKYQKKKLKLNTLYEAIVSSEEVRVGCQRFSHKKILELANLVKKFNR